jgi:hypothetical protein
MMQDSIDPIQAKKDELEALKIELANKRQIAESAHVCIKDLARVERGRQLTNDEQTSLDEAIKRTVWTEKQISVLRDETIPETKAALKALREEKRLANLSEKTAQKSEYERLRGLNNKALIDGIHNVAVLMIRLGLLDANTRYSSGAPRRLVEVAVRQLDSLSFGFWTSAAKQTYDESEINGRLIEAQSTYAAALKIERELDLRIEFLKSPDALEEEGAAVAPVEVAPVEKPVLVPVAAENRHVEQPTPIRREESPSTARRDMGGSIAATFDKMKNERSRKV